MSRFFLTIVLALFTTQTYAVQPPDLILIDLALEERRSAIHMPTGCTAQTVWIGGEFSRGFIVDEDCLPRGVTKRYVPGVAADFVDPNKY